MEHAAPQEEKIQILKSIEAIGNREVDGLDSPRQLMRFLGSADLEIVISALQAAGSFVSDQALFEEVLRLATRHPDEDVRGMASSCLGNIIYDGLAYEDDLPEEAEAPEPLGSSELYQTVKEFLLSRVDALMESMEVRRRVLEALGYLGWKPEIRELVLRFYRQAPNSWVKVSALHAMGLVRDPVFERIILEELHNPDENVLVEAAHAAHLLHLRAAAPRLAELARHANVEVRYEAVMALGLLGNLESLPNLFHRIESENPDSEDITEALGHARAAFKQRSMIESGENIWDDQQVLSEIDEMIENPGNGV